MYSLQQIRTGLAWGLESPSLLLREANRVYYRRRYGPGFYRPGVDVIREDWDTLVILDACRYDVFRGENAIPGTLESRTSRGSHTSEFLRGNFDGRALHDTVYTTASPQLESRRDEISVEFHAVNNVWETDRWDDQEGTVTPSKMTEAAVTAHEQYPEKRHIVHYIQPHYPFIGSDVDDSTRGINEQTESTYDVWEERIRDRIDATTEQLWSAYTRNLNLALDEVEKLCGAIDGRTVVSSDHGNMVGERASPIPIREWGHPYGIYTKQLLKVPWLVHESGQRRSITAEEPTAVRDSDETEIKDRLEDLGYV